MAALVATTSIACTEALPPALLANPAAAPPDLRLACDLTERRCTRCHTLDRVVRWDAQTREQWAPLVSRMRRMSSSGISIADADQVVRCLADREGRVAVADRYFHLMLQPMLGR